jgi:peptidoglycan/LPS O-acetylase OafA/YrhL
MNKRTLGNVLAVIAILFFIAAIVGNAANGSHRWVEPCEQAGWIFFVGAVLVLYLETERAPSESEEEEMKWAPAAWTFGGIAIVLFLFALVLNRVSTQPHGWYEAIELGGTVAMLVTIIAVVMSRGGWHRRTKEKDA